MPHCSLERGCCRLLLGLLCLSVSAGISGLLVPQLQGGTHKRSPPSAPPRAPGMRLRGPRGVGDPRRGARGQPLVPPPGAGGRCTVCAARMPWRARCGTAHAHAHTHMRVQAHTRDFTSCAGGPFGGRERPVGCVTRTRLKPRRHWDPKLCLCVRFEIRLQHRKRSRAESLRRSEIRVAHSRPRAHGEPGAGVKGHTPRAGRGQQRGSR